MPTSTRGGGATVTSSYSGPYATQINAAARANGLDPWWLAAILWVENRFKTNGTSSAGAVGIAQIQLSSHPDVTVAQAQNPNFAIPWAAQYLASLRGRAGGSVTKATMFYNTGPNATQSTLDSAGVAYLDQVNAAYKDLKSKAGVGPPVYDVLKPQQGVNLNSVDPSLLGRLYALAVSLGKTITLTSGYRAGGNDPHARGAAVDATINGQPIGDVVDNATFQKFGLQSGNVAGFYPGHEGDYPRSPNDPAGADPVHVQLPGGTPTQGFNPTVNHGSWLAGVSGWVQKNAGLLGQIGIGVAGGPILGPAAAVGAGMLGLGSDVTGAVTGALGFSWKSLYDAMFWLLFMLLGFALIYLGITRLFDVKPIATIRGGAA